MKAVLPVILATVMLLTAFSGCGTPQQACPKIGDKATDFTLTGADGKSVRLSDLAGKPVIINTWSISCVKCKEEMPYFQDILVKSGQKGIIFISVNTLDSNSDIKGFLSSNGYGFTVYNDIYRKIINTSFCFPASGPSSGDPYTIFIDSNGIIKNIVIGGFASKDDLARAVATLSP